MCSITDWSVLLISCFFYLKVHFAFRDFKQRVKYIICKIPAPKFYILSLLTSVWDWSVLFTFLETSSLLSTRNSILRLEILNMLMLKSCNFYHCLITSDHRQTCPTYAFRSSRESCPFVLKVLHLTILNNDGNYILRATILNTLQIYYFCIYMRF